MPPRTAFQDQAAHARARDRAAPLQPGTRPRLALITAVQDAQRERRTKKPFKRLAAIVPVSDYRDVVG